jgi:hypothetical protein
MTHPAAFVERRQNRSGKAIRLGVGILVAWLGWAWISPPAANATPTPLPTTPPFAGHVLRPSAAGLEPAANLAVQGGVCFELINTCLTLPDLVEAQEQTTTASDGSFHLRFFAYDSCRILPLPGESQKAKRNRQESKRQNTFDFCTLTFAF